ncbi:MAG TPA: sigma 54-interacting transcriptional regulator, partial [Planctomycetota bacterium]|nr:sigma 54-interacting transcriptional regulator [Planctomycetota bacterium]
RIYALQGLFMLEPGSSASFGPEGGTWRVSYEAEQHILHLGLSDYPVCWTLCGLASGYMTISTGKEMAAIEDRCMGKGDPACHVTIKPTDQWGDEFNEQLSVLKRESLDTSLKEVAEALKRTEHLLHERTRKLAQVAKVEEDPAGIVTRSPEMRRVMGLAKTIAKVESTVLITGESGTGKERVARFVHDTSARSAGPFVAVNCGAISESLLESELFGHARGAFTGATMDRPGLFEAANGGTLFLDEVGEIPLAMQVKLLRALQEREVRRVGENTNRPISARIITATNRDLIPEVAAKRFREDLFYRLKVMELAVPPLRRRQEDILPLARILLAESAVRMNRAIDGLTGLVADRLLGYPWPGNVRELANVMERAVAVATKSRIILDDLPPEVRSAPPPPGAGEAVRSLKSIEQDHILAALAAKGGNRKQAAKSLEIGFATLQRKLSSYSKLRPPRTDARSVPPRP